MAVPSVVHRSFGLVLSSSVSARRLLRPITLHPKQSGRRHMGSAAQALSVQWKELQMLSDQLEEERKEMDRKWDGLEQQRMKMSQVPSPAHVSGNDVIGINMGGEGVVMVKRSLLLQTPPESLLRIMFTGRYDSELDRDKDGNVFFDYSPEIIRPLIEFLRLYRDTQPEEADCEAPEIPFAHKRRWNAMVKQLGLRSMMVETFRGVATDLDISSLRGWTQYFCQPYSHKTTYKQLRPPAHLGGNAILVGARLKDSDTLVVAAMGMIDVVTQWAKEPGMHEHNDVYWFCGVARAHEDATAVEFGFTGHADADISNLLGSTDRSPDNLKWCIDGTAGGYVAGNKGVLQFSNEWEKVMFVANIDPI